MENSTQSASLNLVKGLLFVAFLVWITVIVGGITRLTESGLSITVWDPVKGILPPLSHDEWAAAFAQYQKIPEYIQINGPAGMDLADFKRIFFWEWFHRIMGRLVGVSLFIVIAWHWLREQVPAGYKGRLLVLLVLVGFQGALGWYMVASGLEMRTDVSHFRLSAHLLTALAVGGGLVWTALDLVRAPAAKSRLTAMTAIVFGILFIQLLLGAWVAGLDAGYVASDWPLMQGEAVPDGIDWQNGVLYAFTHDPFLLHWLHRWWAWVAVGAFVYMARKTKKAGNRRASIYLHIAFGVQILLGIATVMTGMNIVMAASHQAVGALVVAATVYCAHVLGRAGQEIS